MQNPTTGLTDISNLPADRVKPQEGKFEQSASQTSTMQSVNDVNNENIREQMPQGSLEHLNAEPSLISQGVEAVKEFAHKAVEKIEEFVHATAEKISDLSKGTESKAPTTGDLKESASELKEGVIKRAYLVRKSVSKRLGKKGEKAQKQAGLAAGIAKVYAKEEYKNLRRKANRYGRNFNRDASQAKRSLKQEGSSFGAQLRSGATSFRREARRLLNELPRQAELAKQSLKSEMPSKPTGDFSSDASTPSKFLLEFSSNDMNGRSGKFRSFPAKSTGFEGDFQGKPSQFRMEVSAHDWNESVSTANRYIGFLMDKANDYVKRASRQSHYAQRRFNKETRNLKRSAEGLLEKGKQSL